LFGEEFQVFPDAIKNFPYQRSGLRISRSRDFIADRFGAGSKTKKRQVGERGAAGAGNIFLQK